jgi:hypothetical protein
VKIVALRPEYIVRDKLQMLRFTSFAIHHSRITVESSILTGSLNKQQKRNYIIDLFHPQITYSHITMELSHRHIKKINISFVLCLI